MLVRFLFCHCRFTFYGYAWSSLFGVIMNAQGVATCPPLNGTSLLRRFVSLIASWMRSFSTLVVKQIPNPSKTQRIPSSIPLLLSSVISVVRSGASRSDAIRTRFARLTCSTDSVRSTIVFSHLYLPLVDRCMESLRSCPKPLTIQGHLDQYRRFSSAQFPPSYVSVFRFFRPRFPSSKCDRVLELPPSGPCSPSDARLANRASKTSSFSHFRAPKGYFGLLRSLHGPQLMRFDRGPHRSTSAAMAISSGCF